MEDEKKYAELGKILYKYLEANVIIANIEKWNKKWIVFAIIRGNQFGNCTNR